jgi:general secretion pathway protein K
MSKKDYSLNTRTVISHEKGIALLMVLWVLTILMVIVLSFSFLTRTETFATLSFKGGMEKKFLAEAGIERGIIEIFYRNEYQYQSIELPELGVWKTDGTVYQNQLGDGYYTVSITDESGKVDINTVSEVVLKNIVINLGVQTDHADIIVDSIMDWKDLDDLHRLNGAESDYYMSLPNPYKAKDANFDTAEELLVVQGMTADILYGASNRKGLIDFLTVHSKTNLININTASKEVLMSLPGMSSEIADGILEYRQNKEIEYVEEVLAVIGENFQMATPYMTTEGTGTFTIDASGYKTGEKGSYTVRATISTSGTGGAEDMVRYLYYKSPIHLRQ